MKKISVIFWSGTGNTEEMAKAIANGAVEDGVEVNLISVDEAKLEDVIRVDGVALGCPSMGDEVLEEMEMEPFVESLQGNVDEKPIVLFGSYGWGSGEWMDDWKERMTSYKAKLVESLILNETPDDDGLAQCETLGKTLTQNI